MDRAGELISFTKHLFYLTRMGAPLGESLAGMKNDISDRFLKESVAEMGEEVEKGSSLAEAMSGKSRIFPPEYISMIEVAENTRTLPEVLGELASYLEAVEKSRRNIKNAALYPGLVLNFVLLFIMTVWHFSSGALYKTYVGFFLDMGKSISPLTWFFISAGKVIFSPIFIIIFLVFVMAVDIILFTRSGIGTDLLVKLPGFGDIFKKAYTARISRTLGFMLGRGIPLDQAVNQVALTTDSSMIRDILKRVEERVKKGRPLSSAMQGEKLFENTFCFMVKTGEDTEDLPRALFDAADYYEEDLECFYSSFFKFVEPAFLVTVGLLIGFMTTAIFLPFYNMTGAIN